MAKQILSCAAFSFFDRSQHGIYGVSSVCEFHLHRNYGNRLEGREIATKVDRVLFSGDESTCLAALLELQEFAHVLFGVGVVVAVEGFGHGLDIGRAQLQDEITGPGNSAKNKWTLRNVRGNDASPDAPSGLANEWK